MFLVTSEPLEKVSLAEKLKNPTAGALVVFEGWVRNHNEGKEVKLLEYEAYTQMALREADKVIKEAKEKFAIIDAYGMHRTGKLQIGEIAVIIGVINAHRGEAFSACQYIIDQIKIRLPIWKKEYYVDGDSGWVNCQTCAKHYPETL